MLGRLTAYKSTNIQRTRWRDSKFQPKYVKNSSGLRISKDIVDITGKNEHIEHVLIDS